MLGTGDRGGEVVIIPCLYIIIIINTLYMMLNENSLA